MKIVITGTASSGKTTLANALQQIGHLALPETPTEYITEQLQNGLTMKDILADIVLFERTVVARQVVAEKTLESTVELKEKIVFLDRSLVDCLAFNYMLNMNIEDEIKEEINRANYNVVFMLEKLPFVKTETRWEEKEAEVIKQEQFLHSTYKALGFQFILVPVMSVPERVKFIQDHISQLKISKGQFVFSENASKFGFPPGNSIQHPQPEFNPVQQPNAGENPLQLRH